MGEAALRLAMFTIGVSFVLPRFADSLGLFLPQLVVLGFCMPAALLGTVSFWKVRSFARSWPVLLCVAIAWIGLFHGEMRENHRGMLNVAYISTVLPIAALVVEHRCWWLCARMYVYGSTVAMGLALWFEYGLSTLRMNGVFYRFGNLWDSAGTMRMANPNIVGSELALAAVLALALYLRGGTRAAASSGGKPMRDQLGLWWPLFLSLGVLLTASRGAFGAWLGGMIVLIVWGTRLQVYTKLKELVGVGAVLLASVMFFVVLSDFHPWETLQTRLEDSDKLLSVSGRVPLWTASYEVWASKPKNLLLGVGTGLAPESLGAHLGLRTADGLDIMATNSHNSFVEWGLSFGLLGMLAGGYLLWSIFCKTRHLDQRDGIVFRHAIVVCFLLSSMTYVTIFYIFTCGAGALILAMLSEPAPVVATGQLTRRSATTARNVHHETASNVVRTGRPHGSNVPMLKEERV